MNELSSIAPSASGPGVSVCVGNCARPAALNLLISRVVRRRLARACALGPPRHAAASYRYVILRHNLLLTWVVSTALF